MESPTKAVESQSVSPPSSAGTSSRRLGFYLSPDRKAALLSACVGMMLVATLIALFQPLRPDPRQDTRFWYPIETNPHARLTGVSCANDYACRLNGVFVIGTGDKQDVWAVGNLGLVLHRKPGHLDWEQIKIKASPAPPVNNAATPAPRPVATTSPGRGPTPGPPSTIPVPKLEGLNLREAQNLAAKTGLVLNVVDQSGAKRVTVPSDLVVSQNPAPGTKVKSGTVVNVGITPAQRQAGGLLDALFTTVHAAGPELQSQELNPPPTARSKPGVRQSGTPVPQEQNAAPPTPTPTPSVTPRSPQAPSGLNVSGDGSPAQNARPSPTQTTTTTPRPSPNATRSSSRLIPSRPTPSPSPTSAAVGGMAPAIDVTDDFLCIDCQSADCQILGRTGRLYGGTLAEKDAWTYLQIRFAPGERLLSASSVRGVLFSSYQGDRSFTVLNGISLNSQTSLPFQIMPPRSGDQAQGTVDNLMIWPNDPAGSSSLFGPPRKMALPQGFIQFLIPVTTTIPINIWRVSKDGSVLRSDDMGATWYPNFPGQNVEGWVAGDHGLVLSTHDGGRTWTQETQGTDGAKPNRRLPAPWFWMLAAILIVTSSLIVATPPPPRAAEISVADRAVSDAPLRLGDPDSLDFMPTVLGLSRFIRNPKTRPPITLAIEGKWGEGKSTLMNFLCGDLGKARFRPVWFNAWHHQSEEQLLAALLESIRKQAIPPWWHVDNWIFRTRLLWSRAKWRLVLAGLLLIGSFAYEYARLEHDPSVWPQQMSTTLARISTWHLWSSKQPDPPQPSPTPSGKDSGSSSPDPAANVVGLGTYGVFLGLLGLAVAAFNNFKAFGIDTGKLAGGLTKAASIRKIKPEPGIRIRFQREFDEVCRAWSWGGRRVIIFIDDLDRCRPDCVVTVLESINFLTTAGDCVVVMGIAAETVTHCVGLSFKDIAEAQALFNSKAPTDTNADAEGSFDRDVEMAKARFEYGALYIRKLVNISVPLPHVSEEQRRRILETRIATKASSTEPKRKWRQSVWDTLSSVGAVSLKLLPAAAIVVLAALTIFVGYNMGMSLPPTETAAPVGPTSKPAATQTPTPVAGDETKGSKPDNLPLQYPRPTEQPGQVAPASGSAASRAWWGYLGSALLLFFLGGFLVYVLTGRTNDDAENSKDFEDSLAIWDRFILAVCDTPREVKRALNDLRFQAMTRRTEGPSQTRGERLIRRLRRWVTGSTDEGEPPQRLNEAELPPRKVAEIVPLSGQESDWFWDAGRTEPGSTPSALFKELMAAKQKHIEKFGAWIHEQTQPAGQPDAAMPSPSALGAGASQSS